MRPVHPAMWLTSLWSRVTSWRPPVTWNVTSQCPCRPALAGAVLLTLVLLLVLLSALPFSLFYSVVHDKDALDNYVTRLNNKRTDEALDYLQTLPKKTPEELQAMSRLPPNGGQGSSKVESRMGVVDGGEGGGEKGNGGGEGSPFLFTIITITISRRNPANSNRSVGYVLQSAAALDTMIKQSELFNNNTFFFVCNVEPYPQSHKDAAYLRDIFPYVERYGGSSIPGANDLAFPGKETLYKSMKHTYGEGYENYLNRERHDYTFCLQAAQKIPSKYYLVFQDDAVPRAEFPSVLELTLNKLNKCEKEELEKAKGGVLQSPSSSLKSSSSSSSSSLLTSSGKLYPSKCLSEYPPYTTDLESRRLRRNIHPSPESDFGYLKFYFPDRWNGFSFDPVRIVDLVCLLAVGGGVALAFQFLVFLVRKMSFSPSWRVFFAGIALSLVVCELLGRQNINELRRLSKYFYRLQPAPDCCVPAVLYPAPVMPFLVTWLAESPEFTKVDLRISECFKHYDVVTYYIEPNIVRHVGMVTSLAKTYEKPPEEFLMF